MKPERKELSNGTIVYQLSNGDAHREDGPAIISPNGRKSWWINDDLLIKSDFTSIEMIKKKMQAEELFTPVELAQIRIKDET